MEIHNPDARLSLTPCISLFDRLKPSGEGYLFLPLKIYLPHEGNINIIPVDYFVNTTIKIIENCSGNGIYHLTNPFHTTMKIIAKYYEQLMKVNGVEILSLIHISEPTRPY